MSNSPQQEEAKSNDEDYSFDDFENSPTDDNEMDEENCPLIKVSKEEVREWFRPWRKALVIELIGKNLGPGIIVEQAKFLWQIKGEIAPTDIGNGYIVIHFTNMRD